MVVVRQCAGLADQELAVSEAYDTRLGSSAYGRSRAADARVFQAVEGGGRGQTNEALW